MKKRTGRPPSTGKYDTREEFVAEVWWLYKRTAMNMSQIAARAGVTQPTVANILDTFEGYEEFKKAFPDD